MQLPYSKKKSQRKRGLPLSLIKKRLADSVCSSSFFVVDFNTVAPVLYRPAVFLLRDCETRLKTSLETKHPESLFLSFYLCVVFILKYIQSKIFFFSYTHTHQPRRLVSFLFSFLDFFFVFVFNRVAVGSSSSLLT